MGFLKKLGLVAGQIAATAVGLGPIVSPLFGSKGDKVGGAIQTVSNDLTLIAQTVAQIEVALNGKSGAEKREAALRLIGPIIKTSQIVSGKKIADGALLEAGIGKITDGVVDVLNAIDEKSVEKELKVKVD